MSTQEHRTEVLRRSRFEANLEAGIQGLFLRCPTLCGFAVRDADSLFAEGLDARHAGELIITEVSVYPLFDLEPPAEICQQIIEVILDLVDGRPEDGELLSERSFARVFH